MEYITLNELVESLKAHCEKYGDCKVLTIGAVAGTKNGMGSPYSIHIKVDEYDKWVYVPSRH